SVHSENLAMGGVAQTQASSEIERHLEDPPHTSVIIEIDPKTAEGILADRNAGNRPPKPNKVQQFAADMTRNRWGLTGDTIKFGTNGRLLDLRRPKPTICRRPKWEILSNARRLWN